MAAEPRRVPEGVEPMLTIKEACAVAAVSDATLYRWLADPHLRLRDVVIRLPGGRLRFPAWKFRDWLEKQARFRVKEGSKS